MREGNLPKCSLTGDTSLTRFDLQDVMKKQSSEVVAGNYVIRYLFAAGGSAACLPVIEAIGVGWFSTISALFLVLAALGTWATSIWGHEWQESMEKRWPSEA